MGLHQGRKRSLPTAPRTRVAETFSVEESTGEPVCEPVSAVREYAERALMEPPPVSPSAPYSPTAPAWMVDPIVSLDGTGRPVSWVDTAPRKAWESRRGRAAYELMRENERDQLRAAGEGLHPEMPWGGYPEDASTARVNAVVNHLANRLSVQERERRGWVLPWNRTAPQRRHEDELPEGECTWEPAGWRR